jgi:serine protease Do
MRRAHVLFLALLTVSAFAADKLTITTNPPGADVEIDGIKVGTTPYEVKVPGGYFHGTRSVFGKRLGTQMRVRVSLKGYGSKEMDMAKGPFPWVALNGTYHGDYWLLKTDHYHFDLTPISDTFTGTVETATNSGAIISARPELPIEQVVSQSSPAVLVLRRSDGGSGTGFLITDTGVIATNAHVARGMNTMTAIASNQEEFSVNVVHVDENRDLALLKADGKNLPHLRLAASARSGQTVVAIGTPSKGLQNSVTKGIVSAVGQRADLGTGTWIQTDASINPGNSGGPLLNSWGEVVGINTQKEFMGGDGRPLQGIGFALSSGDLLAVLKQYYPNATVSNFAPEMQASGTGKLTVNSNPDGADVYVDGKFVGNTPSTFALNIGPHKVEVKNPKMKAWERTLELLKDSEVNLKATLEPEK